MTTPTLGQGPGPVWQEDYTATRRTAEEWSVVLWSQSASQHDRQPARTAAAARTAAVAGARAALLLRWRLAPGNMS